MINAFALWTWLRRSPRRLVVGFVIALTMTGLGAMRTHAATPGSATAATRITPPTTAQGADAKATLGPTYAITEKDFLKAIEALLKAKEASGELAKIEREAIERSQRSIHQPRPVMSVQETSAPRTFFWDPTITTSEPFNTPDGKLIVAAGTRVNPLDMVSLTKTLFFFDGRDPRQVAMAERLTVEKDGAVKPILTGGSYIDLMKLWKREVYYDQGGRLVAKFGIAQVPAMVFQEGKRLRIDEIKVTP